MGSIKLEYEDQAVVDKMKQLVTDLLKKSIDYLYLKDYFLIISGQSERSVCARLAFILEKALMLNNINSYYVDVEYIRSDKDHIENGQNTNRKNSKINCDLLIHSRQEIIEADTLLAIEMKVQYNNDIRNDIFRLAHLTQPFTKRTPPNAVRPTLLAYLLKIQKTQYKISQIKWNTRNKNVPIQQEECITKRDINIRYKKRQIVST